MKKKKRLRKSLDNRHKRLILGLFPTKAKKPSHHASAAAVYRKRCASCAPIVEANVLLVGKQGADKMSRRNCCAICCPARNGCR